MGACTTDGSGQCTAGEERVGDYLVIVKYADPSGATVYMGKTKSPADFIDGLASKDFLLIRVVKRDGSVQLSGAARTVVTGSYLEIVYPDFAVWEDMAAGYVYPFIFTSDSDWAVDVCAQVPTGYEIVGVYDEYGDLVSGVDCVQTFVAGETKVVAFDVMEVGSPAPVLGVVLSVEHEGKLTEVEVDVPGARTYVESDTQASPQRVEPAPLAAAETDSDGASRIPWSLVAAALVPVTMILLAGFVVRRRRRA